MALQQNGDEFGIADPWSSTGYWPLDGGGGMGFYDDTTGQWVEDFTSEDPYQWGEPYDPQGYDWLGGGAAWDGMEYDPITGEAYDPYNSYMDIETGVMVPADQLDPTKTYWDPLYSDFVDGSEVVVDSGSGTSLSDAADLIDTPELWERIYNNPTTFPSYSGSTGLSWLDQLGARAANAAAGSTQSRQQTPQQYPRPTVPTGTIAGISTTTILLVVAAVLLFRS